MEEDRHLEEDRHYVRSNVSLLRDRETAIHAFYSCIFPHISMHTIHFRPFPPILQNLKGVVCCLWIIMFWNLANSGTIHEYIWKAQSVFGLKDGKFKRTQSIHNLTGSIGTIRVLFRLHPSAHSEGKNQRKDPIFFGREVLGFEEGGNPCIRIQERKGNPARKPQESKSG